MNSEIRIAIIGDLDSERASHRATNEALHQGADHLGVSLCTEWISTQILTIEKARTKLEEYHGIFCAPGGPYRSTVGALEAIRFARERNWPFLGT